jgi:hypothetical protein
LVELTTCKKPKGINTSMVETPKRQINIRHHAVTRWLIMMASSWFNAA